jgi:hypothetical protein
VDTDELIRRLVENSKPVRRVPAPGARTLTWLMLSLPYLGVIVMVMSPRPDLASRLVDPRYLVEQFAALATALGSATTAFALAVPGLHRARLLPVAVLSIWLTSLGVGCANDWFTFGASGMVLHLDLMCVPAIIITGTLPAVAMIVMLRRGALFWPRWTLAFAGLAAAALADFAVRLFHAEDASLMVLVWQFGTVALISLLLGAWGRRVASLP